MRTAQAMAMAGVMIVMATTGRGAPAKAAVAAPATATPDTSLLSNGDFDAAAAGDSVAPGWFNASTTNVSCVAEAGNHFLRLHSTEPGKMVMVYRAVPMKPEYKALELSYRVRFDDIQAGAQAWFDGRIMMNFKDADGNVLASPSPPIFRGTQNAWEPRSQKFPVPEGAAKLEIMPALFQAASGTLDFDDFRLVPIRAP